MHVCINIGPRSHKRHVPGNVFRYMASCLLIDRNRPLILLYYGIKGIYTYNSEIAMINNESGKGRLRSRFKFKFLVFILSRTRNF